MPKTRHQAARVVAETFLPLEKQVQELAASTSRCVAVIIEERTRAMLPPTLCARALTLTAEAAQHLVLAANAFADAHADLHQVGLALGVDTNMYDDSSPPNTGGTGSFLVQPDLQIVRKAA